MAVVDPFVINMINGRILAAYRRMCEACALLDWTAAVAARDTMDEQLDLLALLARRLRASAA